MRSAEAGRPRVADRKVKVSPAAEHIDRPTFWCLDEFREETSAVLSFVGSTEDTLSLGPGPTRL